WGTISSMRDPGEALTARYPRPRYSKVSALRHRQAARHSALLPFPFRAFGSGNGADPSRLCQARPAPGRFEAPRRRGAVEGLVEGGRVAAREQLAPERLADHHDVRRVEAHGPGRGDVDERRVEAADEQARLDRGGAQRALALAGHDAVDDGE